MDKKTFESSHRDRVILESHEVGDLRETTMTRLLGDGSETVEMTGTYEVLDLSLVNDDLALSIDSVPQNEFFAHQERATQWRGGGR
jgi:hypothetical protein